MELLTQAFTEDGERGYLPRGRHHLTREQVVATQRGRMLLGMAEAVAEKGYAATSVADVIGRAGTSRETFYQQFANKQDCFLAAYDQCVRVLVEAVQAAVGTEELAPVERLQRMLDAYVEVLAEEPAIARTFLIEVYAAGPEAIQRRIVVQQNFTALVAAAFADDKRFASLPDLPFACEMFVGGVAAVVTARLIAGEDLHGLREPIIRSLQSFVAQASRPAT